MIDCLLSSRKLYDYIFEYITHIYICTCVLSGFTRFLLHTKIHMYICCTYPFVVVFLRFLASFKYFYCYCKRFELISFSFFFSFFLNIYTGKLFVLLLLLLSELSQDERYFNEIYSRFPKENILNVRRGTPFGGRQCHQPPASSHQPTGQQATWQYGK